MKEKLIGLLRYGILSVFICFAFSTAGISSFAENNEAGTIYSYEGQEYFDPLDCRSLLEVYSQVPSPKALDRSEITWFWSYSGRNQDDMMRDYEAAVNNILKQIDPGWTDLEKVIFLHDYICDTTNYSFDEDGNTISGGITQTAYACLVDHSCVCDGYARAFYDVANRAGVRAYYVMSDQMNHAWNMVEINGKHFYLDLTWDGSYDETKHKYFLKSYSAMEGHQYTDIYIPDYSDLYNIKKNYIYGKYNDRDYDNALWTRMDSSLIMFPGCRFIYIDSFKAYMATNPFKAFLFTTKSVDSKYDYSKEQLTDIVKVGNNLFASGTGGIFICEPDIDNKTLYLDTIYSTSNAAVRHYITNLKVEGNKMYYDVKYWYNEGTDRTESIDIGEYLSSSKYKYDYSGSETFIQGYNCVWNTVNGKSYWYENGIKQGTYDDAAGVMGDGTIRGREIYDPASDGWYWLDSVYFGAKAVNKEVWIPYIFQNESDMNLAEMQNVSSNSDGGMDGLGNVVYNAMLYGTGKWVRYDENGKMFKGWVTITGSLASLYPAQKGNTYYYDNQTGLMAKGYVKINGKTYHFDETSGVLLN